MKDDKQSTAFWQRLHFRSMFWILGVILTLIMVQIIPGKAWEAWYYEGLFIIFRVTYDFLLGWSPVPMVYWIFIIMLFRIVLWMRQWKRGWAYQLSSAAGGVSLLVLLFYWLWGFNYRQIPLQERLGLNLEKVNAEQIRLEFHRASEDLMVQANNLPDEWIQDDVIRHRQVNDGQLRPDLEKALESLELPSSGKVRVRQLWPKGFLLRWSTAGIYIPQTGEGHIDMGLLSVQKPFTMAHEMAHGYGVTDEGACNFIAWLACSQSRDPWIKFSGALSYWRYAAAELPADSVGLVLQTLPPVVHRSLALIKENDRRYPDLFPKIRDKIYASYLKRHGVKGGLRSYNYVVMMVRQYIQSKSSDDFPE